MMAEPSYYPLSPLKSPFQGATLYSPEQSSKDDLADLPHLVGSGGVKDPPGSCSSTSLSPLRPQLFRKGTSAGRPYSWRTIQTPLEMALLPLVAIGYLAFCYTVHGKAIPVNTYGLYAVTPQHFGGCYISSVSRSISKISYTGCHSYYQRWYHFYQYHHRLDRALPNL